MSASPEEPPTSSRQPPQPLPHHRTKEREVKRITNSNSDRLCLDQQPQNRSIRNFVSRFWYHITLHNGLYMLDPTEKMALNTAGLLFTILTVLYLWSFLRGFSDGWWHHQQETTTTSNDNILTTASSGGDLLLSSITAASSNSSAESSIMETLLSSPEEL